MRTGPKDCWLNLLEQRRGSEEKLRQKTLHSLFFKEEILIFYRKDMDAECEKLFQNYFPSIVEYFAIYGLFVSVAFRKSILGLCKSLNGVCSCLYSRFRLHDDDDHDRASSVGGFRWKGGGRRGRRRRRRRRGMGVGVCITLINWDYIAFFERKCFTQLCPILLIASGYIPSVYIPSVYCARART